MEMANENTFDYATRYRCSCRSNEAYRI